MSFDQTMADALRVICERLGQRTATLFVGAGINFGLTDSGGSPFPLGADLAALICRDLLNDPDAKIPLDDAAEMARHRVGARELNKYIYEAFNRFSPGTAHLVAVQLPWDAIFTTNYDLLIEQAATATVHPAGSIQPIVSADTDVTTLTETDIPYYKLHGSAEQANTAQGRLVLTKEDYDHYETHRLPLFKRLRRDLVSRTMVFVGYSLVDNNLRRIITECTHSLGIASLPLSYAIRPRFTAVEEAFWRDRYNIQLVRADATDFLLELKKSWDNETRVLMSPEERRRRFDVAVDDYTAFPRVGSSYYQIAVARCAGKADASEFYRGGVPRWADVRDHIAPERDIFWPLADALFAELQNPLMSPASAYLVTGAAGTGKTTLLRQLTWMLAKDFNSVCLEYLPGTPLDYRPLGALLDPARPVRIVLVIRNAVEVAGEITNLLRDLRTNQLPVTLLLEERRNQWSAPRHGTRMPGIVAEYELGELSKDEIHAILSSLAQHGALGKLGAATHEEQIAHFEAVASKELLVALRELTVGDNFDNIVRDEYQRIPSAEGRRAYAYACALGLADLAIRYETILRLLNVTAEDAKHLIFGPTQGVLLSHEDVGSSRHNMGFRLRARHPVIASVIFDAATPTDSDKFDVFNDILSELDPGYPEDARLLREFVFRRELIGTIADPMLRRRIFERLEVLLPGNPAVLQHRSILEKDLGESGQAIEYAKKALALEPHNPSMMNTLGLAYENGARHEASPAQRRAFLSEAERLFADGVKRDPGNPYGYVGKAALMKQRIEAEPDAYKRATLRSELIVMLEDALEATQGSSIVAGELAEQRSRMGDSDDAIEILNGALKGKRSDTRVRDQLIWLHTKRGETRLALTLALEGLKVDPAAWRLHRHVARLRRAAGEDLAAVVHSYEAAIRYRPSDLTMRLELGVCLFQCSRYPEATEVFRQARQASGNVPSRTYWSHKLVGPDNRERRFTGKVVSASGANGVVRAEPDNFEASFWRDATLTNLRVGQQVSFRVFFDLKGPHARIEVERA